MSIALYRKYRPQTFAELVGQNHIKITLQNELATGKISHAYLFSGPRGLGKTTVARLIAKAVNCLERKDGESEPCNHCEACLEVMEGRSLDVLEIDAASHTGVDNVRENIIANTRFTPSKRKFKVYIIDEVHMLSLSAFNALLKTLEEPPAHVIFILATTEIHKIPDTIISRCQRFDFRKVSTADLLPRLVQISKQEKKSVEAGVLERVARYSAGGVRDAESLLGQILSLDEKKITTQHADLVIPASRFNLVLELVGYLLQKNIAAAMLLVNNLVQEGIDLQRFTSDLIEVLRKLLLAKVSDQLSDFAVDLSVEFQPEVAALLKTVQTLELVKIIELFIQAQKELKSAEIIQLPLELAIAVICQSASGSKSIDTVTTTRNNQADDLTKSVKISHNEPAVDKSGEEGGVVVEVESKPASRAKGTAITLTIEQVSQRWDEVLELLKSHNQSLASTLKHHRPTAVNSEGAVEIGFKYKFYQQRVIEIKNRRALEDAMEKVFQVALRVEAILVKNLPSQVADTKKIETTESQTIESLAQTFGGQVID